MDAGIKNLFKTSSESSRRPPAKFDGVSYFMSERKSISKKTRFEVFKRDSFCCQYCSARSPNVLLEIDHIVPVSKGGKNDIDNLLTACFDCNRGKSDNLLKSIPATLLEKTKSKKESLKQYKDYLKALEEERIVFEMQIDAVQDIFSATFTTFVFTDKFRLSVKKFIEVLGVEETKISMESACRRIRDRNKASLYFCGICWGKIKAL